ncbi:hypothetical protein D1953_02260 [Peribacillus asahii]|uniref:Competence protein ComGF n=1 Tax=Peribacillus asahii TaxID=228899 RepID=A0A398BLL1_9BACI|nr:competence type IV pilus minor pilin ComGF [Peribacillus asahii]RID89408.1 hypothetical protein D1953_02260 [Peribacillus asahii]
MLQKSNGFTMVEMLISLVVFMMISLFVLQIFLVMYPNLIMNKQLHHKEWEVFSIQLQKELRESKNQTVKNNKLYLLTNGSVASVELYQNIVRRQVEGLGHEILLQNVADFQVNQKGNQISVQVTDYSGKQYSRTFHPYFKKEFNVNEE